MMDVTFHRGSAPLLAAAGAYLGRERFSGSVLAMVARCTVDGEAVGEDTAELISDVGRALPASKAVEYSATQVATVSECGHWQVGYEHRG
ncbi:MAG: hypothetical protein ACYDH5_08560 [Acidimicrobiales bacterium]